MKTMLLMSWLALGLVCFIAGSGCSDYADDDDSADDAAANDDAQDNHTLDDDLTDDDSMDDDAADDDTNDDDAIDDDAVDDDTIDDDTVDDDVTDDDTTPTDDDAVDDDAADDDTTPADDDAADDDTIDDDTVDDDTIDDDTIDDDTTPIDDDTMIDDDTFIDDDTAVDDDTIDGVIIERVDGGSYFTEDQPRLALLPSGETVAVAVRGRSLVIERPVQDQFIEEVIDPLGRQPSLALDESGNMYISYYDPVAQDLRLATDAAGVWEISIVDTAGDVGQNSSIAVRDGLIHIAYFDWTNNALKYACGSEKGWSFSVINTNIADTDTDTSIAADSLGNAHVTYYHEINDRLDYAANASGEWVIETPAPDVAGGWTSKIIVDADDFLHIGFSGAAQYKYTTNRSGEWQTENAGFILSFGILSGSLALDRDGYAHAAINVFYTNPYVYLTNVWYATNRSGHWKLDLQSNFSDRYMPDLAMDEADQPMILAINTYTTRDGDLYLHYQSDGQWSGRNFFVPKIMYNPTRPTLDADNQPHLVYSYKTDDFDPYYSAMYAVRQNQIWIRTPLEGIYAGYDPGSLILDDQDRAHLFYTAENDGAHLMHATNSSGAWQTETLNDSGQFYLVRAAIDTGGHFHLIFEQVFDDYYTLLYATDAAGAWVTVQIDGPAPYGYSYSLALDGADLAHIAYVDKDTDQLKYAVDQSGTWVTEVVPTDSGVYDADLAVDAPGYAYIAYWTFQGYHLSVLTNASGSWTSEEVDFSPVPPEAFRIALDDQHFIHIISQQNLEVAHTDNKAGLWQKEWIDQVGQTGFHLSQVIRGDFEHLSYYSGPERAIWYATFPK